MTSRFLSSLILLAALVGCARESGDTRASFAISQSKAQELALACLSHMPPASQCSRTVEACDAWAQQNAIVCIDPAGCDGMNFPVWFDLKKVK